MNVIDTGDCIAVPVAHGIIGRLTQFFTRSRYTHTGTAIWVADRLYMAELNGGRNHLVPMTQLTKYDIYACPAGLDPAKVEAAIIQMLALPIDYGFISFPVIGLLNWLKIKVFVHWRKIIVCSGFVVAIYELSGWPERSRVISPQELVDQLVLKFSVG